MSIRRPLTDVEIGKCLEFSEKLSIFYNRYANLLKNDESLKPVHLLYNNLGYFNYVIKYDIVGNEESNEYHAGDQFIKRFREVMEMYIKGYARLNDAIINELIMSVYDILLPSRRMYEGKIIRNMKNDVVYLVQKSQLLPIRTEEIRLITDNVIDVYEPEIFED
jgi:hypothetical protein